MEGLFDHPTIVLRLIENLSPFSYICLRRANPRYFLSPRTAKFPSVFDLFWKHFEWNLRNLLAGEDETAINRLCFYLNNYLRCDKKVSLTGGFLLSILNGDTISPLQDLDFISDNNFFPDGVLDILREFSHKVDIDEIDEPYEEAATMAMVSYRMHRRDSIFTIQIKQDEIVPTVKKYDLNFCKNFTCQGKICIDEFESVLNRRCLVYMSNIAKEKMLFSRDGNLKNGQRQANLLARWKKYVARGYDIRIHWQPDRIIEKVNLKECMRGISLQGAKNILNGRMVVPIEDCDCHKTWCTKCAYRRVYFDAAKHLQAIEQVKIMVDDWNRYWSFHLVEIDLNLFSLARTNN